MSGSDMPRGAYMAKELKRIAVIGPVYPFKGGISHYTGLMVKALKKEYEVECVSYSMQYPRILFKKEQRDYANKTFEIKDTLFTINTANPFNWFRAAKDIKGLKPDLVIVQWWHPYFAPCYQGLLSKLKGIPVFFICHNVLPHERFPLDKLLSKNTLKLASGCIVHSKEDEADLKEMLPGMPYKRNMHPTYNAFRLKGMSRADARSELGIGADEKILLFFGLVRKYKGLKYLIEAAPGCVDALEKVKICVVGDFGGNKEEYMSLIKASGVEDHFIIRDGYVPDAEVEPYFAAADLCICPYISATQSGIVQIAFGFGLPVIATEVGGLPEAVRDKKTGYIVPPADKDALAAAIISFFEEEKALEFKENIKDDEKRFSWENMVMTISELYKEVSA